MKPHCLLKEFLSEPVKLWMFQSKKACICYIHALWDSEKYTKEQDSLM